MHDWDSLLWRLRCPISPPPPPLPNRPPDPMTIELVDITRGERNLPRRVT